MLKVIQAFLSNCRRPAVLELGDEMISLIAGEYSLAVEDERLRIETWTGKRSLSRQIVGINQQAPGALDCTIRKFGGAPAQMSFLDLDRPQSLAKTQRGERHQFAQQFRQMLTRQFPGWEIRTLTTGLDLQRSLSSVFPRACLRRGASSIAAIACETPENESAFLTYALLWLDQARARYGATTVLCLFLADGCGALTAHRLAWLSGISSGTTIFRFNQHGSAGEIDLHDLGNIKTEVTQTTGAQRISRQARLFLERLAKYDSVYGCPELSGEVSLRCRGFEFGRLRRDRVEYGLHDRTEVLLDSAGAVESFAAHLADLMSSKTGTGDVDMPVRPYPERWLESVVRENLPAVHASLIPTEVHGQVLTSMAGDRDLIDLLSITVDGRLAVLELKTAEDIHLPLQALDYWARVAHHARAGELQHLFPDRPIKPAPPLLLLVAPAIAFHSTTTTILRYFSKEVEVQRIGLNSQWQRGLKVVLRLYNADEPQSHRTY